MSFYTMTLNIEELLKPSVDRIKNEVRKELESKALAMVQEEVAKFAIDVSRLVSINDMGNQIVITIRKELGPELNK